MTLTTLSTQNFVEFFSKVGTYGFFELLIMNLKSDF